MAIGPATGVTAVVAPPPAEGMTATMALHVRDNTIRHRYELVDDADESGEVLGFADYQVQGDRVVFPHTVIDPRHRGRGLGAVLIEGALDDVRASGRRVVAQCWFVDEFLDARPDYADLRAPA